MVPEQSAKTVPVEEGSPADAGGESGQADVPVSNNAVIALLDSADREITAGDHESAAASIERALRLEPKNGLLWHRLGALRLKQGNWQQAVVLAHKSNSLVAGDYSLQAANWRLIAAARREMGDDEGAKEAGQKAEKLDRQVDQKRD